MNNVLFLNPSIQEVKRRVEHLKMVREQLDAELEVHERILQLDKLARASDG